MCLEKKSLNILIKEHYDYTFQAALIETDVKSLIFENSLLLSHRIMGNRLDLEREHTSLQML